MSLFTYCIFIGLNVGFYMTFLCFTFLSFTKVLVSFCHMLSNVPPAKEGKLKGTFSVLLHLTVVQEINLGAENIGNCYSRKRPKCHKIMKRIINCISEMLETPNKYFEQKKAMNYFSFEKYVSVTVQEQTDPSVCTHPASWTEIKCGSH